MAQKSRQKPAGAMKAAAVASLAAALSPPTAAPPDADALPEMPPISGATDGLGAGTGGLAVHPSLKGHNIMGREPKHSSRTR